MTWNWWNGQENGYESQPLKLYNYEKSAVTNINFAFVIKDEYEEHKKITNQIEALQKRNG